jgi:hypothetical protein
MEKDGHVANEERVRALVDRVLGSADFEGKAEFTAQVAHLSVGEGPITFLPLVVDRLAVPPSTFVGTRVPGEAWVMDADGAPLGILVVWVEAGYMTALEYGWVTSDPPTALPSPHAVRTRT